MAILQNMPEINLGVVGVSRDCFPASLTRRRLDDFAAALKKKKIDAHICPTVIENENDAMTALQDMEENEVDAVIIYLGNFGPEGPTTIFAERFGGPVMVVAAAEENKTVLATERGDALCGLLNCSYSLNLRQLGAYIPQYPVGLAKDLANHAETFQAIARILIGVSNLKIFGFGPRPQDFFACNAPIQPLYDLGVEVMENSELDLFRLFKETASRKKDIDAIAKDMQKELGKKGCVYPDLLPKLAQFELTLLDFMEKNIGASEFAVFANKCWPSFEFEFGFVPCYINSRLAGRGIPVACEVDLYGALSEYIVQLATQSPATLLDINNSVPDDILPKKPNLAGAKKEDLWMGFHCGNTCSSCMANCKLNYQVIMNRLMEGGGTPDITRGTLEGTIKPGATTIFRLQSTPDCTLRSYIAEGEILPYDPCSFGAIAIFAIPQFARFYRHVLVGKHFPHHAAIGFAKTGKALFEAMKYFGIEDISVPLPPTMLYEGENPFEVL